MPNEPVDKHRCLHDPAYLADTLRQALASVELDSLLWRLAELLHQRMGFHCVSFGVVEGSGVTFRTPHGARSDCPLQPLGAWQRPQQAGALARVLERRETEHCAGSPPGAEVAAATEGGVGRGCTLVPLVHQQSVAAVLVVAEPGGGPLAADEVRLLERVAALAAPSVLAAARLDQEQRRAGYLQIESEVGRMAMASPDRGQLLGMVCRGLVDRLRLSFAALVICDESGGFPVLARYASAAPFSEGVDAERWPARVLAGAGAAALAEHAPWCCDDLSGSPGVQPIVVGTRSVLALPIGLLGDVVGVLAVEHPTAGYFTSLERARMGDLALMLAEALDHAEIFDQQQRRWQHLLLANEMARVASERLNVEEIACRVVSELAHRFRYPTVALWLAEPPHVVLRAVRSQLALDTGVGDRERLGEGCAGWATQYGRVVRVDEAEQLGDRRALGAGRESLLCVPIGSPDWPIGALQLESPEPGVFGEDDELLLEALAHALAGVLAGAQALARTQRLREDLTRMIVHDLRNPLQAVQLGLGSLLASERPAVEARERLRESGRCIDEMLALVSSLLDVARFEDGKMRLRLAPAALNDHIRAVVRRYAPLARAKAVQMTTVLSPQLPAMQLDGELIERMLANVVGNALKFTPEGAPVTIQSALLETPRPEWSLPAGTVLVSVRDSGEGIPTEYHEKIFEKFGQVEARRAGLTTSTGLGLALCRYVAEAHGGRIWVESAPDDGSTFLIALPLAAAGGKLAGAGARSLASGE
ncbi:MAG: GAF domain-containing protein [Proteobacteria bacterium]|nr:GAF domain-containing protein [Pseudomonadota bacterium]